MFLHIHDPSNWNRESAMKNDLVGVTLLPDMKPEESASFAGKLCYTSTLPKVGVTMNVRENLFSVSHHTTLQHSGAFFSFALEGIAVGDVTFGLHLTSPFYNTDQRSGRYAGKMFTNPDYDGMLDYVARYWPEVSTGDLNLITEYLTFGVRYYQNNVAATVEVAAKLLKEERPYIKQDVLERIAPKVAQEQMRMFIPVLFPTGLVFTVNATALAALYEEAWTPAMKDVTEKMAQAVVQKHPEIAYMFDEKRRRTDEWSIPVPEEPGTVVSAPYLKLCRAHDQELFVLPDPEVMFPVDRLHFRPELMENNVSGIRMTVGMSVATMGQDQRHRTLRRGTPRFTGAFYLPPLLTGTDWVRHGHAATKMMKMWGTLSKRLPGTLSMVLAPYGAVVEYTKEGSFNAILHEQFKRLCWCAQEEIYWLGCLERNAIAEAYGASSPLLSIFQPPCFRDGKCAEGDRYCGRDISLRKTGDYFPRREV